MIKTTAPYKLPGYKTLELVVISEPVSSSDNYDPSSIPESSNPVMAEERTHSRAREQRPSRIPVQNIDVDVDEDDEEEEWHLDLHNVLIVLIFGFIKLYFNFCCNIIDQSTDCCILFLI
jgi:hypothetical protein